MIKGKSNRLFELLFILVMLSGCSVLRQKASASFTTGQYILHSDVDTSRTQVFATVSDDSISVFPLDHTTIVASYNASTMPITAHGSTRENHG